MLDYMAKAGIAWFLGFFPWIEIYAAVPGAIAMGLDHISAATWAVLGNYTPVLLIVFGYDRLMRIEKIRGWLEKRTSERIKNMINRYGVWFVLFITPWVGVWIVATAARFLGMNRGSLLVSSFISVAAYGFLIAYGVHKGVAFFANGT